MSKDVQLKVRLSADDAQRLDELAVRLSDHLGVPMNWSMTIRYLLNAEQMPEIDSLIMAHQKRVTKRKG